MNKLTLFAALTFSALAFAGNPTTSKLEVKQSDLTWAQPFGPKGPSVGFVEGKFGDKQPASFFVKVPAGGDSGWHFHDESYQGVVLAGTFTAQQSGDAAETKLPPGTYYLQPAKTVHRNGCLKGTDCLIYVHFPNGADSTPSTREGQALKK